MNEWIDFVVFATQAVMLWIVMPRWGARFTRAMVFDRNPEWAAANPMAVASLVQGGIWMTVIQAWGLVSVTVLLLFRLDLQPSFLSPVALETPGWEVLMTTSNLLMMAGFIMVGFAVVRYLRWLKHHVPLAQRRQASLMPRSLDDFVPRWLQYPVFGLLVISVLARPVVDFLYPGHLANVWGAFITTLLVSPILLFIVIGGVVRPPNIFDRTLGAAYRRREVRFGFGLVLCMAVASLITLYLEYVGVEMRRYGAVLTSAFVTSMLVGMTSFPVPPHDGAEQAGGQARVA